MFINLWYCKSNGQPTIQIRLSQNYDFVFTNQLKNEAQLCGPLETIMAFMVRDLKTFGTQWFKPGVSN